MDCNEGKIGCGIGRFYELLTLAIEVRGRTTKRQCKKYNLEKFDIYLILITINEVQ